MVGRGEVRAAASVATMLEYEAVLKRPEHLRAAGLQSHHIDSLLDSLAALFIPVTPSFVWRPLLSDPNDELILEAAINGPCDVLVTFNTRHFREAAARFGITTLTPAEFLQKVRHDNDQLRPPPASLPDGGA